ncbi:MULTISPECIES: hypothetical protein [Novacetimonas]|uniref:Uncharacterized protein n=2 Tax=Novacetimonas hansenii TaxID=436 RepID=A0AAW5ES60_NOVHA|nr:hypothetical protein [Novacetimonas hansenii]MCJ8354434.1 hypothetical protein [Novacetimonas hansenii]WEQ58974.1 hypothetical protein LV563_14415 [Novacetimonas hansenii]CUW47523.1 hypothetical protein ATCC53582_01640 [Novacetimonas hansenii]GAN82850.1 hypothetical protein Gaha_0049_007 [Novacetimonas hansenii JCM 7643]GEC62621.1 hypothetical protein GHA01_04700 [Novacetimonas hansenii]
MSDSLDPKELKILSDILALVLEDNPGQSENALAAIRTRARKNQMTGGALKNLFAAIAPNPPPRPAAKPRAARSGRTSAAAAREIQDSHARISEMADSIRTLDDELRNARKLNEKLRSELLLTQQARAETQTTLAQIQARLATTNTRATPRRTTLMLALTIGTLAGIAMTELFHALDSSPAQASAPYIAAPYTTPSRHGGAPHPTAQPLSQQHQLSGGLPS